MVRPTVGTLHSIETDLPDKDSSSQEEIKLGGSSTRDRPRPRMAQNYPSSSSCSITAMLSNHNELENAVSSKPPLQPKPPAGDKTASG